MQTEVFADKWLPPGGYPINIALSAKTGPEPGRHWPAATRSGPELAQFWHLRQCLWVYYG